MQAENAILHFLRTFPIWMITLPLYILNEVLYLYYQDPFIKDMTRDSWNALLVSIGIRIAQPPTSQQNTEKGDITNVINQPTESTSKPLDELKPEEIEGAVNLEELKEEK